MTERFAYNPLIVEEVYGVAGALNCGYQGILRAQYFGNFLGTFETKDEASFALAKEATKALLRVIKNTEAK
jgi:hypothetical protein